MMTRWCIAFLVFLAQYPCLMLLWFWYSDEEEKPCMYHHHHHHPDHHISHLTEIFLHLTLHWQAFKEISQEDKTMTFFFRENYFGSNTLFASWIMFITFCVSTWYWKLILVSSVFRFRYDMSWVSDNFLQQCFAECMSWWL